MLPSNCYVTFKYLYSTFWSEAPRLVLRFGVIFVRTCGSSRPSRRPCCSALSSSSRTSPSILFLTLLLLPSSSSSYSSLHPLPHLFTSVCVCVYLCVHVCVCQEMSHLCTFSVNLYDCMLPSNTWSMFWSEAPRLVLRFGVILYTRVISPSRRPRCSALSSSSRTSPSILFLTYFSLHPLPHPTPSILFLIVLPSSSSPFYLHLCACVRDRVCAFICVCMFVCVSRNESPL